MRYIIRRDARRATRISIGIPTYNGVERTGWLLQTLQRTLSSRTGVALTLLDDGSPRTDQREGLVALAHQYDANCLVHPKNEGITKSWNDLVRFVDAEFTILLNDDLFLTEHWLENLIYFLENNACGAAAWNILFCTRDDVPNLLAGHPVTPRDPLTKAHSPDRAQQSPDEPPGVVMCPIGCGFGFRRSVYDQLGGFDERTRQVYNESLPGHEYVLIRDQNGTRLSSFDDLWKQYGREDISDDHTVATPADLECLSAKIVQGHRQAFLTGNQKLVLLTGEPRSVLNYTKKKIANFSYVEGIWQKVTGLVRHRRHNKLLHVRQKSGSVFVTENHSMVVNKDGSFEVVTPKEMETATLPRAEYTPLPVTRTRLDLGQYLQDWDQHRQDENDIWYLGRNWRREISEKRASKKIPRWFDLTSSQGEALCWLLGFHVAEGCTSISKNPKNKGQIVITVASNADLLLVERTETLVRNLFRLQPRRCVSIKGRYKPIYNVQVGHKSLGMLLRKICGVGARNKFVPDFLYEAPIPCREAFLSGYVAGDGWSIVSKNGLDEVVQMETTSRKLAAGLSILCSSLEKLLLVHYRPQMQSYAIRTVMHTRPNRDTKNVEEADAQTEFVYDLEVENSHVFCAGVGPVVVHNSWLGTKAARDLKLPCYQIPAPRIWHLWSATFQTNPELRVPGSDRAAYEKEFGGNFEVTHPKFMVGTMPPRVVKWLGPDGQPREKELTVQ